MKDNAPRFIYKIVPADQWLASTGKNVPPAEVDKRDGYVHFSTADQLAETLSLYFAGQKTRILAVETARVRERLKWEPSRHGDLFPHLYGEFEKALVAFSLDLEVPPDGTVTLPAEIV